MERVLQVEPGVPGRGGVVPLTAYALTAQQALWRASEVPARGECIWSGAVVREPKLLTVMASKGTSSYSVRSSANSVATRALTVEELEIAQGMTLGGWGAVQSRGAIQSHTSNTQAEAGSPSVPSSFGERSVGWVGSYDGATVFRGFTSLAGGLQESCLDGQRRKMIGNSFTIPVIQHILAKCAPTCTANHLLPEQQRLRLFVS
jgi:hypothetical protein